MGRDFVIRLGEDGLTPDLLFIDRVRLANLHEYYLDGPPAVVVEITLESSAERERVVKRRLYEQAGVPEYWLIEAADQQAVFWCLGTDGRYHQAALDPQGIYHSTAVSGLALSLPHLWTMDDRDWDQPWLPFLRPVYGGDRTPRERRYEPDELTWGSLPFAPRAGLEPVPVRFEEFISWCPEAKFESYGPGLAIGGHEGSRRVMGLLLMTLGLAEVVKLATPRDWVTFLYPEPYQDLVEQRTEALMAQARYESHEHGYDDRNYVVGEIPQLPEVTAYEDTEDECRQSLRDAVRNWVLLRIARGQESLPGARALG